MSDLFAQLACIWEATARKPGNVHRYRDFHDATYLDFMMSAAAISPVMASAPNRRVGETVLAAIQATRRVTASNTNLGIVLLLAPLAAVPAEQDLRDGVERVLAGLDLEDSRLVYQAIRLARPAGLGEVSEEDIEKEPTRPLREVMQLAADRDLIARQYANGFREVFSEGMSALAQGMEDTESLEGAIIFCHLRLMAAFPDSLIARKLGRAMAEEAAERAKAVLDRDWPHSASGWPAFHELDAWLRDPEHARNPGTTADLVTACLFVGLRTGMLNVPSRLPWSSEDRKSVV